ncbi:hypothetical protein FRC11_009346 [Ceratobasidium sp. 423]|nr:hypothetical protein FRC11_009346 [Ceratobasidium sp. 423]
MENDAPLKTKAMVGALEQLKAEAPSTALQKEATESDGPTTKVVPESMVIPPEYALDPPTVALPVNDSSVPPMYSLAPEEVSLNPNVDSEMTPDEYKFSMIVGWPIWDMDENASPTKPSLGSEEKLSDSEMAAEKY